MATSRKAPDLVIDTSPQLGGNLDVNGHTVDGVDIASSSGRCGSKFKLSIIDS